MPADPPSRRSRQPLLFRLEDPLTARFGTAFFGTLPPCPGVYFFTGDEDRLLYIGQSANLRARIGSYRHVAQGRHPRRSLRLVAAVRHIAWEPCGSAMEAIRRERDLLLERRPPFNRAGVWPGSPWWLAAVAVRGGLSLRLERAPADADADDARLGRLGPLPATFRYRLGPLCRWVQRLSAPQLPIHAYPHGLMRPLVPRSLHLRTPDPPLAWQWITSFSAGDPEPMRVRMESMPDETSPAMTEFWSEQWQHLTGTLPPLPITPPAPAGTTSCMDDP